MFLPARLVGVGPRSCKAATGGRIFYAEAVIVQSELVNEVVAE